MEKTSLKAPQSATSSSSFHRKRLSYYLGKSKPLFIEKFHSMNVIDRKDRQPFATDIVSLLRPPRVKNMLEKQVEISIDQRAIVAAVTRFAEMAHRGQTRKYTVEPYIVHPVRVMEICRQVTCDTKVLYAALLHDVLEDTAVTAYEIHSYLYALLGTPGAKQTLDLVVELTDVYTKSAYPVWNR